VRFYSTRNHHLERVTVTRVPKQRVWTRDVNPASYLQVRDVDGDWQVWLDGVPIIMHGKPFDGVAETLQKPTLGWRREHQYDNA
jgi:hypothetical protein